VNEVCGPNPAENHAKKFCCKITKSLCARSQKSWLHTAQKLRARFQKVVCTLTKKMNLPNQEEELLDYKDSVDFFATLPKNGSSGQWYRFNLKITARLEQLEEYQQQAVDCEPLLRQIAKQRAKLHELRRRREVDNRVFDENTPIDKLVERIL
jgi:hypothetical protein